MLFTPEMSGLLDRDSGRGEPSPDEEDDPVLAAVPRGGGETTDLGPSRLARGARRGRQARQPRLRDRRRGRSAPATTRSICSTSTCRPARAGANPPSMRRARARWWSTARRSGKLGLTICYDLRFPASSRARRGRRRPDRVPAAFTVPTGRRTGTCCCAPGRSRPAPSSSPRRRSGVTRTAARPTAIRWSSIPGARCCSTWARRSGSRLRRDRPRAHSRSALALPALSHRRPIPTR
jgi:hypothetical protein